MADVPVPPTAPEPTAGGGSPGMLMAELWYDAPPQVDAEEIVRRLQATQPGSRLLESDGAGAGPDSGVVLIEHTSITLQLEDRALPLATVVMPAGPPAERAEARDLTQSWDVDDADALAASGRWAVLVTEMVGRVFPVGERVRGFVATLQAVVAATRPVAIWNPFCTKLLTPEALAEHELAALVNVRMFSISNDPGVTLMDSLGLHVLDLPDVQCHFRGLDPSAVAQVLYNTAAYLFRQGDVIDDGHTVPGVAPDDMWRCQHEDALWGPDRLVLDLDPGDLYAAGHRSGRPTS